MKCPRCGGYGVIPNFKHIEGGICFLCKGVGTITAAEYAAYQEEENKRAVRSENKIVKHERMMQAQKLFHEERLKNGYYKRKREEEEQARMKKHREKQVAENPQFVQHTADESLKEFFSLFDDDE